MEDKMRICVEDFPFNTIISSVSRVEYPHEQCTELRFQAFDPVGEFFGSRTLGCGGKDQPSRTAATALAHGSRLSPVSALADTAR